MKVNFIDPSGAPTTLDLDPSEPLDNVAAIVEASTGIPVDEQSYSTATGSALSFQAGATLSSAGIRDGDTIRVTRKSAQAAGPAVRSRAAGAAAGGARRPPRRAGGFDLSSLMQQSASVDPSTYPALTWDTLPPGTDPKMLYEILRVNPGMMLRIQSNDPELAAAAKEPTWAKFREVYMRRTLEQSLPEIERKTKMAQMESRLASNPFDVDAQRYMEDEIARANVDANYELAYEHMPEAFTRVHMLYVDAQINGHPVKVFVDSGAQTTIMSQRCAERCGLLRLLDKRFAGMAVGVGKAVISGKVHMAPMVMGGTHFPATFTVLQQDNNDCLLGLDMLKRYQACIDLENNVLRMKVGHGGQSESAGAGSGSSNSSGYVSVPFLAERDVPKDHFGMGSQEDGDDAMGSEGGGRVTGGGSGAGSESPAGGNGAGARSDAAARAGAAAALRAGGAASGSGNAAGTAGASSGGRGSVNQEAAIAQLTAMGFPREQCSRALGMTYGNVELAAGILMEGGL